MGETISCDKGESIRLHNNYFKVAVTIHRGKKY